MRRKDFIKTVLTLSAMNSLNQLKAYSDDLPSQGKLMPVLFTSHGSPLDIPVSRDERPFWKRLYELGRTLEKNYDVKAVLVISAHWCTKGTYVNISDKQEQIYDYYGFPAHYYDPVYHAPGAPEIASEVKKIVPSINETKDWGLDHGAWPMLMHLFPKANIPTFQMSIYYDAKPQYHYDLGVQLKSLRKKGILIIGSGSLIHNLQLTMQRMRDKNMSLFGWESEYDLWLKTQIENRNFDNLINYTSSHKLGKLASPTPDHYVPVLYSLGLMDRNDEIEFFYEGSPSLPAFSERSFLIKNI
ncbi:MAG: dioxygenase [Flavobacteriales bacterium]|nr:dioxygenase [Flavobacteriales bacterium]